MIVLLIGSGGREHALAWKISQSPLLKTLYCAPGNPGIFDCATKAIIDLNNQDDILQFCKNNSVDLVVVGPEAPLVDGLADTLRAGGVHVFGPSAKAAQLEASKGFTKDLCAKYNIPTGYYQRFNNAPKAKAYARKMGAPIVIKADGLAAGKGVTVAMEIENALSAIDDCFEGAFGQAGAEVVVEEYLAGEEASFFCLCDGEIALPFMSAQDHKTVGEGDTGPNTGGMGAYSPAPVMSKLIQERTMKEIVLPTIKAMADEGNPFVGVLFVGLMITQKGPELIEFNVRFGDPECQVIMMRLDNDLLPILKAAASGNLSGHTVKENPQTALSVVMASKGYPASYEKNTLIEGVPGLASEKSVKVFHAGTKQEDGKLFAIGGRVLNITATGSNVSQAQDKAYAAIDKINWPNGFCRSDIGWRAIKRENEK